ncbi:MAG: aminotransferase class V-fold PLP-dependent enzyme [candidate division WOR-3 bacterium]|nr:MAG: aminotransferase class V-fold PLP-dependent enzyme [candidate division WOR-3 bacterium]
MMIRKTYHGLTPRKLFPITERSIYFNHAGTGPLSIPARRAIEECLGVYTAQAEFKTEAYFERIDECRHTVADFIDATPEEIVFTHNTSQGIYIALMNIPFANGDKILVMDEVFPAVRYIVDHNLPQVEKLYVRFADSDPVERVKPYLGSGVKAVVLDWVQYLSGEMVDLERLSGILKEYGVYLVVDGIQAVGAVPFSARTADVDFLSSGAAKWLFGPSGAGFLYVNKRTFPKLNRVHAGWLGARWKDFLDCQTRPALFDDARMFEQGTRNVIGISALAENIRMLQAFDIGHVYEHICTLKASLREGFESLGFEIVTPARGDQSGIITMKPRERAAALYERFVDNSIVISLRSGCLRFSPHFYNTQHEVETILNLL